jgi:3-oxoacyl-(acyl-carrier-protein) synthase
VLCDEVLASFRLASDRDPIRAVIRGYAVNNDGATKVGFMAPSVEGHADVVTEALAVADVAAETISYLEAHGTGRGWCFLREHRRYSEQRGGESGGARRADGELVHGSPLRWRRVARNSTRVGI